MNGFFERMIDYLTATLKLGHILLAALIISGTLVANPFHINDTLGVTTEVAKYKFPITITFLFSSVIATLICITLIWTKIKSASNRIKYDWEIKRLPLGAEEVFLLHFLESRHPDGMALKSSHPKVLTLRKFHLIESWSTIPLSDCDNYNLTEKGQKAARAFPHDAHSSTTTDRKLAFLEDASGNKYSVSDKVGF